MRKAAQLGAYETDTYLRESIINGGAGIGFQGGYHFHWRAGNCLKFKILDKETAYGCS
jgi:hypothetical protein